MLTYNDFMNKEEFKYNRNYLRQSLMSIYKSNRGSIIRIYMDFGEYENEVHITLIKYWNYDSKLSSLNTYLRRVLENATSTIIREMNADKRKINYITEMTRIDDFTEMDNEIHLGLVYEQDYLNSNKCINYIVDGIKNEVDKMIIKLYLLDFTKIEISKICNINYKTMDYRIKTKYKKLMQDRFNEYRNAI